MPFMWALWLCRFAQTSAAVLLVGTAVPRLLAFGTDLDIASTGWRGLAWMSATVALLAGALQLGLTAADMSGEPFARAISNGALSDTLDGTGFGFVWKVRAAIVVAWFIVALAALQFPRLGLPVPGAVDLIATLLAVALLASLVFAGHAGASERGAWLLPVTMAHAIAAGAWPGGLWPLALLLTRAQRSASLLPTAIAVTRRYSRLSVGAVGVLAGSGLCNGVGMVGTLGALATTTYGWLVLCKVALFALMIGLGAVNRRMLRTPEPADRARTVRLLWRNIALETLLAVGVLLATEALATSPPPMPAR